MATPGFLPGVVTETTALAGAPWYRREPYLVFFPLGVDMSWAGVAHWLLHALGLLERYRPIFHAMVQIQCFMMSFAAGFLLTMIPRRTGSAGMRRGGIYRRDGDVAAARHPQDARESARLTIRAPRSHAQSVEMLSSSIFR